MDPAFIQLLSIFSGIGFNPISSSAIIALIFTIILLAASAFMSASEVAFFALGPKELDKLSSQNKNERLVLELHSKPEELLATILIGNNFVNVAIIILSTFITNSLINFNDNIVLAFVFQSIVITFLLLLFGEVMPKIYATHKPKSFAFKGARIILFLQKLFYPLVVIMVRSTGIINKRMQKHSKTNISIDELSHALKLTSNVEDENREILEGIVSFGNTNVSEIMSSRTTMVQIELNSNFKEVLSTIIESGYSRIPVYATTADNIRGILYIKDLLPHLDKSQTYRWQSLIRPAYFVPETKKIDDLLSDFQKNRIHIAIVVDEYGGTSGLVTLEDILEEIVGDISDEYDEEETLFSKIDENNYIFEAKISLNDFFKITGCKEENFEEITNEVDTLAGLILEIKGEIPHKKEIISYKNFVFEILKADDRKIEKVKLNIIDSASGAGI